MSAYSFLGSLSVMAAVGALCFSWRLLPLLGRRHQGCDAYYYLLAVEEFKKKKKMPIVLPPYYALENQESWYPPGFIVFLSLFPRKLLDKIYWVISPAWDTLICLTLFIFMAFLCDNPYSATLASLIYAFSPSARAETNALTSRQMGAFLLSATIISASLFTASHGLLLLSLTVLFGMLLLFTHKLSTQALYITFPLMSAITGRIEFVLLVLLFFAVAMILSKGFYLKILRSHIDYIRFWSKHWRKLGAHAVNDSSIYGGKNPEEISSPLYVAGSASTMISRYLRDNIYLCIPLFLLFRYFSGGNIPDYLWFLSLYSLLVSLVGLLSYVVPLFRGIGFFWQYGKLGLPAGLVCLAYSPQSNLVIYVGVAVLAALVLPAARQSFHEVLAFLRKDSVADRTIWDLDNMEGLLAYVRSLKDPILMCLPLNYCDLLAYHCRVRVLWGGHTSPAARLTPVLPVLASRVEDIWRDNDITHLFTDDRFATPASLGLTMDPVWRQYPFSIYKVR